MDYAIHRGATLADVLWRLVGSKRLELNRMVANETGGVVHSGPFQGMKILTDRSWGDGDLGSKLLGTYEQELHPAVERLITQGYRAIVNVGCAEGYYAIGLGNAVSKIPIFAYDIDEAAQKVCKMAAEKNGLEDRVITRGLCTAEELQELASDFAPMLCVIDCEGFELDLITPESAHALSTSDLLIECHDFSHPGCTSTLKQRLAETHNITDIRAGARNPHAFSSLKQLDELDRWLLVCEMRPTAMNWIICEAKKRVAA